MLKARFILPAIISLLLVGGAAMAQTVDVEAGGPASVSNQLIIHLPVVVALHIIGTSGNNDITFSPSQTDIYNAASTPTTIGPDANGFQRILAFTNADNGGNFGVSATAVNTGTTGTDGTNVLAAVAINGSSLNGYSASVARGAVTSVFSSSDVTLALDGTLGPGDYTYDVTYTLTASN